MRRFQIDWDELCAREPTHDELVTHAPALAAAWNDPHNAPLMGHSAAFEAREVVETYEAMQQAGARPFLLFRQGRLAGDGDFRGLASGTAEFAFMVASPAEQGRGLGTRFALMLHAFGFGELGLHRSYAAVDPVNTGSRRVFEKLGFTVDPSPAARALADEPGDLVLSIARPTFVGLHAPALEAIRCGPRG